MWCIDEIYPSIYCHMYSDIRIYPIYVKMCPIVGRKLLGSDLAEFLSYYIEYFSSLIMYMCLFLESWYFVLAYVFPHDLASDVICYGLLSVLLHASISIKTSCVQLLSRLQKAAHNTPSLLWCSRCLLILQSAHFCLNGSVLMVIQKDLQRLLCEESSLRNWTC